MDSTVDRFATLREVLSAIARIDEPEWAMIRGLFRPREFDAGMHLMEPGGDGQSLFFLGGGLVRFYYLTAEGKEFNKSFAVAGDFCGSLSSVVLGVPARYGLQALEPTPALVASHRAVRARMDESPVWERIGRVLAEGLAVRKEIREAELLLDSAETRYRRFLAEQSDLASRLPDFHIASYLGVTNVALSRIRRRIGLVGSPG